MYLLSCSEQYCCHNNTRKLKCNTMQSSKIVCKDTLIDRQNITCITKDMYTVYRNPCVLVYHICYISQKTHKYVNTDLLSQTLY